jgi:hypothetical protein
MTTRHGAATREDATMIEATARNARETDTGASYKGVPGTDVDVSVTMPDGSVVTGEVTLLPRENGQPGLTSWGDPGNWISSGLLAALKRLDGADFSDALDAIEAAAQSAVPVESEVHS